MTRRNRSTARVRRRLGTPQPLPSAAPRIGEGEEHVFNYLLITRYASEVKLLCGIAKPKHRYRYSSCGVRLVHLAWHTRDLRLLRLSWAGGLTSAAGTGSEDAVLSV